MSAVDLPSGTITISARALGGARSVTIRISSDAILRRYAPNSVNFDDAKPSTLDQIKTGDQLLARGTRSADGSELAAEEVVSGSFRNIAGTIVSIGSDSNTLSVMDLITKKPVDVKIAADSQIRKLPPQMAQFMAMRLKGQAGAGPGGAGNGPDTTGVQPQAGRQGPASGDGNGVSGGTGGREGRAGGDLQQILNRVPRATLADLQKGDAVMIVATSGNGAGPVTAITLVSGVEPLLEASPNGGAQSMILPPWSMDAPTGDATP